MRKGPKNNSKRGAKQSSNFGVNHSSSQGSGQGGRQRPKNRSKPGPHSRSGPPGKRGSHSRGDTEGFRSSPKILTGRVQKNPKGFAFIIPTDSTQPDSYVAKQDARLLLPGDIVEYRSRRDGRRTSADIQKVVTRGQSEILGFLSRQHHQECVETPEGDLYFLKRGEKSVQSEQWVIAKIVEYPTHRSPALVTVVESLGKTLTPKHDNQIAIAKYGLPNEFNPAVLKDAEISRDWATKELLSPSEFRRDLRSLPFVTVDGEDAKDFDDAILVSKQTDGGYILYVAIADVSFFVRPKTELDKSALERATSVYLPGTCIPMLPETLSNDLCSLRPQTDKLTLTAEIHYDASANVKKTEFYESIIRTEQRVTYNQLHGFFESDPVQKEKYALLEKPFFSALELFEKLLKKRAERGVLDFELPESQMELDEKGIPKLIFRRPRLEAHRLIEEFMIAANSEVAKALRLGRASALYRVHETPEFDKIDELNALIKRLGFNHIVKEASPMAFSKVLAATQGVKGSHTLHQAILRTQKQAKYEPLPKGHFGLALLDYTHFTSPIRRYPDLAVHRALKAFILRLKDADKFTEGLDFVDLGEKTSLRERRAMEAERFVTRRKQCWFMEQHLTKEFDGVISGVIERGLFIEIPEFALEGFVPADSLKEFHEFDEARMLFRKRPGHTTLSVGDSMRIQVMSVEVDMGKITFAKVEAKK